MQDTSYHRMIDIRVVYIKIKENRKLFYKILPIVLIATYLICVCVPRTYQSSISLAPEMDNSSSVGGSLSSIASSFGIDLSSIQSTDALYPLLYPDLFKSNEFVAQLLKTNVETIAGDLSTDYYDYMLNHQKQTLFIIPIRYLKNKIRSWFPKKDPRFLCTVNKSEIDPFLLSERQLSVFESVKKNIVCSVDKKTMVITITVIDQDPLIAATMADSACAHLQNFITSYRTSKARNDEAYYKRLVEKSKREYEESMIRYSRFSDSHRDAFLQSYISQRDELENDMDLKYNTYTAVLTQYSSAQAKVQESIPAFTVLNSASVPIRPFAPKRLLISLGMTIMAALIISLYSIRDLLFKE